MGGRGILRSLIISLLSLAVLAVVCIAAAYFYVTDRFDRPGPLLTSAEVVLPPGRGAFQIADTLYQAGVLADPNIFAAGVWLEDTSGALKAGEYAFEPGMSAREVMVKLVGGAVIERSLTVPEGLSSAAVLALISAESALKGEFVDTPPEGSLLPETYQYRRGDTRASLVDRMRAAMQDVLARLWPNRAPDLPVTTQEQAIILASIVEKETALATERPMVASVFINRLRQDMPLQSDPTVIYALTLGARDLGRALSRADLRIDSPFNTYRGRGLPPAPIANPGRESLAAVLNPATSDALFFVADGTGGHAFAKTLAEHNRNVARWRRIRDAGADDGEATN